MPIAVIGNDNIYYIHTDHLATPRIATDKNKNIVWQWQSTPFGKGAPIENGLTLNLRFPGQYFDSESSLHYNHFRYYNSHTGRYITSDQLGLVGGLNSYNYVYANPIRLKDFRGLIPTDAEIRAQAQALDTFDKRQQFYQQAHQNLQTTSGAIISQWFKAAALVNQADVLGGIDLPGSSTIFDSQTIDFLKFAGIELAIKNLKNYYLLLEGRDIPGLEALSGQDLDNALVEFEQNNLENIYNAYFSSPCFSKKDVNDNLNDIFNGNGIFEMLASISLNATVADVLEKNFFSRGINFDIGNVQHRIILGQGIVGSSY